jgi:hypothetical protein
MSEANVTLKDKKLRTQIHWSCSQLRMLLPSAFLLIGGSYKYRSCGYPEVTVVNIQGRDYKAEMKLPPSVLWRHKL